MKQFILGIFAFIMVMVTAGVGYASDIPKTEKATIEDVVFMEKCLIAQADVTPVTVMQVTSDGSPVDNIINISGIKVDTVKSIEDILDKGYYYVENPPDKSWSVKDWYGYIAGIIGLGFGIYIFIRDQIRAKKQ